MISLSQIHSAIVQVLPAARQDDAASRPQGDAMVTAAPGLALGILTADCAPVSGEGVKALAFARRRNLASR